MAEAGIRVCERRHSTGVPATFVFTSRDHSPALCTFHALTFRPMVRRSLLTAIVVGIVLTAINQGNVILGGDFPAQLWWKIPLTFCVPYAVATFGAMGAARIG